MPNIDTLVFIVFFGVMFSVGFIILLAVFVRAYIPKEVMRKFTRPRFIHWVYAQLVGYFWVKCPLCGRWYGGHEDHGSIPTSPYSGRSVCPQCKEEGRRISRKYYNSPECRAADDANYGKGSTVIRG
jgi:hypothetical protein